MRKIISNKRIMSEFFEGKAQRRGEKSQLTRSESTANSEAKRLIFT